MKRKLAIVFGLLLVMGATLPVGPVIADNDVDEVYMALGNSLVVGVGASDWNPFDPTTPSPALAYVPQFHEFLIDDKNEDKNKNKVKDTDKGLILNSLGVSGETSSTFISEGQLAAAIASIISPTDTETVTLDIGGNDLLGLLFSEPCASDPFGDDCKDAVEVALGTFGVNYGTILGGLTGALALDPGNEELMVMTFYNPFDGLGAVDPSFLVREAVVDQALVGVDGVIDCVANANPANAALVGLNDIIACTGMFFGATVVDVYPLFDGAALALTHIAFFGVDPSFAIHPNDLGYAVIAGAFSNAYDD